MSHDPRPGGFGAAQEAALRAAFGLGTRAHGEACPALEDIERALAGELTGEALARVTQALAECADCAALARMSTEVAQAAQLASRAGGAAVAGNAASAGRAANVAAVSADGVQRTDAAQRTDGAQRADGVQSTDALRDISSRLRADNSRGAASHSDSDVSGTGRESAAAHDVPQARADGLRDSSNAARARGDAGASHHGATPQSRADGLRDTSIAARARDAASGRTPSAADDMPPLVGRIGTLTRRRAAARRGWPWAVAAVLMIAVGLGALLPVLRDGDADGTLRGVADAAAVLPPPAAVLDAPPLEFRWEEERGASGYIVEVFDAAAEPVWNSATLTGARAVPDAVARERLQRGEFVWRVQALGGEQPRTLGPWRFTVRGAH